MANLSESKVQGVRSSRDEVVAAAIPRNSGVINQVGQHVSVKEAMIHLLMQDTQLTGRGCTWRHTSRHDGGDVDYLCY